MKTVFGENIVLSASISLHSYAPEPKRFLVFVRKIYAWGETLIDFFQCPPTHTYCILCSMLCLVFQLTHTYTQTGTGSQNSTRSTDTTRHQTTDIVHWKYWKSDLFAPILMHINGLRLLYEVFPWAIRNANTHTATCTHTHTQPHALSTLT